VVVQNWLDALLAISPCRFTASLLLHLSNPKLPLHETFWSLVQLLCLNIEMGMTHSPRTGEFWSLSQQVKGQSSSKSSKATAIKRSSSSFMNWAKFTTLGLPIFL
jgi:hypothetical protein